MQSFFLILTIASFIVFLLALYHRFRQSSKRTTRHGHSTSRDDMIEHASIVPYEHPVERYPSKDEQSLEKEQEEEKIIGITQPVGYWSNRIFQEKLPMLLSRLSGIKNEGGFWQQYVRNSENNKQSHTDQYRQDRGLRKGINTRNTRRGRSR